MATSSKFVSYLRVSTQRQGKSGLGLEAQRATVTEYLNGGSWKLIAEIVEIESGKDKDRPKLAEALRLCRIHGATLIIAKLDRLARNVAFVSGLMEAKVKFVAVDLPEANDLTVHIMAAIAEHEAKMISGRTIAALAAAKARGMELGGIRENSASIWHKGNPASIKARKQAAAIKAADLIPIIDSIREEGITALRGIAASLNERSIPTPRKGGQWSAAQVLRIINTKPIT